MSSNNNKEYKQTAIVVVVTTLLLVLNVLALGVFKTIQTELIILMFFVLMIDILFAVKLIAEYLKQNDLFIKHFKN